MQNKLKIPTLIYSRCVGYFSPTAGWNKAKQEEFKDRKYLNYEEKLNAQSDHEVRLQQGQRALASV